MGLTDGVGFGDAPDLQIAGPDGTDLALLDQIVERLHGFFKRCCGIVAMGVVQIDSVRLQAAEALFALAFDLSGAKSTCASRVIEAQFCRDHHLIANAAVFHPGADRRLALAALAAGEPRRVEISSVNERPAFFAEEIEQSE